MTKLTNAQKQKIAELAGRITNSYIEVLQDDSLDISWDQVLFAGFLAAKTIATVEMHDEPEEQMLAHLRQIFDTALNQTINAKKFTSKAAMEKWLAENGILSPEPPNNKTDLH